MSLARSITVSAALAASVVLMSGIPDRLFGQARPAAPLTGPAGQVISNDGTTPAEGNAVDAARGGRFAASGSHAYVDDLGYVSGGERIDVAVSIDRDLTLCPSGVQVTIVIEEANHGTGVRTTFHKIFFSGTITYKAPISGMVVLIIKPPEGFERCFGNVNAEIVRGLWQAPPTALFARPTDRTVAHDLSTTVRNGSDGMNIRPPPFLTWGSIGIVRPFGYVDQGQIFKASVMINPDEGTCVGESQGALVQMMIVALAINRARTVARVFQNFDQNGGTLTWSASFPAVVFVFLDPYSSNFLCTGWLGTVIDQREEAAPKP